MAKRTVNNVKLGSFVLAGLFFLILLLYMIGKNSNLFGSTFVLKARFGNVQGLISGNNVRYSGIEVGTVRKISILNDTVIEVSMIIKDEMKKYIRSNAIASIGTDGLIGNKVINILPSRTGGNLVEDGSVLSTRKAIDTDEMLLTLDKTNEDIAVIAANLKTTVLNVNNSSTLWSVLNDKSLPIRIKETALNLQMATARTADMADDLQFIVQNVKEGRGSVGQLLMDSGFSDNLNQAIEQLKATGEKANHLAGTLDSAVKDINTEVLSGKGAVNALLRDSGIVIKLNSSLDNIEEGTQSFQENMEALKQNFLFRGYFRKMEKRKNKALKETMVNK